MDSFTEREPIPDVQAEGARESAPSRSASESIKTAEEYRRLLHDVDERLGELYRERRLIMEAFSEDYPPLLPPPRQRTEHQQRVARCPRCSAKLESSETA